jgi:hypothetical protein
MSEQPRATRNVIVWVLVAVGWVLLSVVVLSQPKPTPSPDASAALGASYAGTNNPTGMNPLCTTGPALANGLVCKTTGPATVRSCHFFSSSDAGAWAALADLTVIPTSFAQGMDAGASDAGPGLVGDPIYLTAQADRIVGTDYFGTSGWQTTTGFSVGISTVGPVVDGGGTPFTAAANAFQITCNGQ